MLLSDNLPHNLEFHTYCILAEPNNDSPLNTHAAGLWPNKTEFKKLLLEKYNKEVSEAQKGSS